MADVLLSSKENKSYGATQDDLQYDNLGFDGHHENTEKGKTSSQTKYDEALTSCGYGKFHLLLTIICGWANASDAVEILCISFLLPSAECDLDLTYARKGHINSILFAGMLIGGFFWGSLGDIYGRRNTLIVAMMVNAVAGAVSSLSQNYPTFLALRFLSGLGVGGSIPLVWTYFAEFQPSSKRGGALSVLASFWMIGNITVAGLAWAIIPHQLEWSSWRVFTVVSAAPSFIISIALLSLPESPKFLLCRDQQDQSLEVMRRIFSSNTGRSRAEFPVSQIVNDTEESAKPQAGSRLDQLLSVFRGLKELFSGSLMKISITMLLINFAIQFGYYGLWMWFPELFNELDKYHDIYPNVTKTVCEIVAEELPEDDQTVNCDGYIPKDEVFINSFIISLAAAPGNLWTIVSMDKLGRKFFLCLSMILSGAAAFLIYLITSSTIYLVISCVFGAVSTMGFNSLDCLSVEVFPTHLRSTAMAVTLVAARLGAICGNEIFGQLLGINCAIPIIMVAALMIAGGLLGLILPNTTRTPLV